MITFFTLALIIVAVEGSSYENNKTNVGVYANHISSCNLDHKMGDMLCINRDYESVIQYHDVSNVVFCPYHYCVTFRTEKNKLICTGYSYLEMSGSMSDIINPLSQNNSALALAGEGDVTNIKVGKSYEGYNILIDYFRPSVETMFDASEFIVDVTCGESDSEMVTCAYLSDGSEHCFGATDITFNDFIPSIVLGVAVPGSLSLACYLILWALSTKWSWATNGCITTMLTPIIVEVICMVILFVGAGFIVKVLPFLIASLVGIWIGKVLCDIITGCFGAWKSKMVGKVDDEYGAGERTGMLRNSNSDKGNSRFVISDDNDDDDGGMTEIELGSVAGADDEAAEVKRI